MKPRRKNPVARTLGLFAAVLLAPSWLSAADAPRQGPPPAPVTVAEATTDKFAATMWVPGTIVSRHDARIAAEIGGRVVWIAEPGARIQQGEAIARLDDRLLKLAVREAESQIKSLEAQLKYQNRQLARLQQLASSNNAAANQLDEAQSQLDISTQQLEQAKVNRDQAQARLNDATVKAPFDGRLVNRLVQLGEYMSPGTPIARLVDTEHKEIRAPAPISISDFISPGMTVAVKNERREILTPIKSVIPVGDERSRMFEVRVALEGEEWVIGGAVRVALPNSLPREMVAIPRDALVLRGSDMFVYRIDAEGKAERVNVTTGIGIGPLVEVKGQIEPGDRLVVRGAEQLQPGQTVEINNASPG